MCLSRSLQISFVKARHELKPHSLHSPAVEDVTQLWKEDLGCGVLYEKWCEVTIYFPPSLPQLHLQFIPHCCYVGRDEVVLRNLSSDENGRLD